MGASSSRVSIRDEDSTPSFHRKIDLSRLKSYFDHLARKLNDSMLHPINDDVTARVRCLKDKQETLSDKCSLILRIFFQASIVENPEVAVKDWQEVAALNLLVEWFMSEANKIEKNLAGMTSDIDIGRLFISEDDAMKDTSIARVLALKEQEGSVQEAGNRAESSAHKEKMIKMAEASVDGDSSDPALSDALPVQKLKPERKQVGTAKGKQKEHSKTSFACNEDGAKLGRILKKVKRIDNRVGSMFPDLFFLLKRYDQEIVVISQFKISLVQARTGEDEPWFIEKIIDLLELADKELNSVKEWWMIEGTEGRSPEETSREITKANKLLSELMGLALRLERFREFHGLLEPRTDDVVMLEKTLEESEAELLKMEAKVKPLQFKVKNGKFTSVVTALCHAAYCIESVEV